MKRRTQPLTASELSVRSRRLHFSLCAPLARSANISAVRPTIRHLTNGAVASQSDSDRDGEQPKGEGGVLTYTHGRRPVALDGRGTVRRCRCQVRLRRYRQRPHSSLSFILRGSKAGEYTSTLLANPSKHHSSGDGRVLLAGRRYRRRCQRGPRSWRDEMCFLLVATAAGRAGSAFLSHCLAKTMCTV